MFTTIFFDLDGTLTDPGMGITNSVAYALRQTGREVPLREELYAYIGPPLLDQFQATYGMSLDEARVLVDHFHNYFERQGILENQLYEGIPQALQALKDAGATLVVATSKPEPFALRVLERFDLTRYFTLVAGSTLDEQRTHKADVIAYAMETLGRPMGKALMVGDRKHDVLGAKVHGIPTVGALYGYGSREELTEAGAVAIADTVADLVPVITSLEYIKI